MKEQIVKPFLKMASLFYRRMWLVLFIVGYGNLPATAQQSPDCTTLFTRAFNDFRTPSQLGYEMSYAMETVFSNNQVSSEEVHVRMNNLRSFVQAGKNMIYRDEKVTVMIDDNRKLILITEVTDQSTDPARFSQAALLQDSLLSGTDHISCQSEMAEDGSAYIKVSFDAGNRVVKSMGLAELYYWINKNTEQLEKIYAVYSPGSSQIKSVRVSFDQYSKAYNGDAFTGSALSKVYDQNGRVRSDFKQYEVINNSQN